MKQKKNTKNYDKHENENTFFYNFCSVKSKFIRWNIWLCFAVAVFLNIYVLFLPTVFIKTKCFFFLPRTHKKKLETRLPTGKLHNKLNKICYLTLGYTCCCCCWWLVFSNIRCYAPVPCAFCFLFWYTHVTSWSHWDWRTAFILYLNANIRSACTTETYMDRWMDGWTEISFRNVFSVGDRFSLLS